MDLNEPLETRGEPAEQKVTVQVNLPDSMAGLIMVCTFLVCLTVVVVAVLGR